VVNVTTFAGSGTATFANGTGTAASFDNPVGIAYYQTTGSSISSNLFVADKNNHRIRMITPSGVVTTYSGNGTGGYLNTNVLTNAIYYYPAGLAIDNVHIFPTFLFIGDTFNNRVREISTIVTSLAGSGSANSNDGIGTGASFNHPVGIAVTSAYVFVADQNNNKIRMINISSSNTSTYAGTGTAGSDNGATNAATFSGPTGLAVNLATGDLYIADTGNNMIRKITSAGVVSTLAGSTSGGRLDGRGTSARFNAPQGIAIDTNGNIYVADTGNHSIRKITPSGYVTTIAGDGNSGSTDSTGINAEFAVPCGITVDNAGVIYVADTGNNKIRKITQ
jgi:hypothetical protein